jgi:hypothetical protein
MGQQQFLMIVLSVIIVGAAIVTGITVFNAQAKSSNRNAIIQDMYSIASLCIAYYKTPEIQAGGGGSWDSANFLKFCGYPLSKNGKYILTDNGRIQVKELSNERLQVQGWGSEIGYDENKAVRARLRLKGHDVDEAQFKIIN